MLRGGFCRGINPAPFGQGIAIDAAEICAKERSLFSMGILKKRFGKSDCVLYAPMKGRTVALAEVPDPAFAQGMLGKGVAIEPTDGKVCAPCDARVDSVFATGHAVSLVADCGAEILIHVGLETVGLKGGPFTVHVKHGDRVRKGQLLIEADLEAIKAAGLSTVTPMVICNTEAFTAVTAPSGKAVTQADVVIELTM